MIKITIAILTPVLPPEKETTAIGAANKPVRVVTRAEQCIFKSGETLYELPSLSPFRADLGRHLFRFRQALVLAHQKRGS